jgi:hypothetical protein
MGPRMDLIRYRPGEAIRWLETGAQSSRKTAAEKGRSLVRSDSGDTIGSQLKKAAGALFDVGRGAYTDLLHRRAQAGEFLLHEAFFEIESSGRTQRVNYDQVLSIEQKGDRTLVTHEKGVLTIKPYAYIVSGRIRIPIGWSRNGMEVPYELLIEELCARCGVNLQAL